MRRRAVTGVILRPRSGSAPQAKAYSKADAAPLEAGDRMSAGTGPGLAWPLPACVNRR